MKTLTLTLLFPILLKTCDGLPEQHGTPPPKPDFSYDQHSGGGTGGTGGGNGSSSNGTTDAPLDGGLIALLAGGALYGAKRYRSARKN